MVSTYQRPPGPSIAVKVVCTVVSRSRRRTRYSCRPPHHEPGPVLGEGPLIMRDHALHDDEPLFDLIGFQVGDGRPLIGPPDGGHAAQILRLGGGEEGGDRVPTGRRARRPAAEHRHGGPLGPGLWRRRHGGADEGFRAGHDAKRQDTQDS